LRRLGFCKEQGAMNKEQAQQRQANGTEKSKHRACRQHRAWWRSGSHKYCRGQAAGGTALVEAGQVGVLVGAGAAVAVGAAYLQVQLLKPVLAY
nr:hypothetical protein [Tanacetum cinerariifolium]